MKYGDSLNRYQTHLSLQFNSSVIAMSFFLSTLGNALDILTQISCKKIGAENPPGIGKGKKMRETNQQKAMFTEFYINYPRRWGNFTVMLVHLKNTKLLPSFR